MKTRKKLLHSTLILALAFGQTSGTVVEAVSMLSSVESSAVKQSSKKNEKNKNTSTKKKKEAKEVIEDQKEAIKSSRSSSGSTLLADVPTFTQAVPIPDSIPMPYSSEARVVGNHILNYLREQIPALLDDSKSDFKVGETITYEVPSVIANHKDRTPSTFWNGWVDLDMGDKLHLGLLTTTDTIFLYNKIHYITIISESGNWQIHITPPDSAIKLGLLLV